MISQKTDAFPMLQLLIYINLPLNWNGHKSVYEKWVVNLRQKDTNILQVEFELG